MKLMRTFIISFFLLKITICSAAVNYSGFLAQNIGARAAGLGGAYTAIADTNAAILSNPSGLPYLKKSSVSTLYSRFFNEVDHYWMSASLPTEFGHFGIGYVAMKVQDIIRANSLGDKTGTFDYSDQALFISYANRINSALSFGVNCKGIQQSAILSYTGFGADVSLLYKDKNFNIGAIIQDIIKTSIGTDTMATRFTVGIAYFWNQFTLSGDMKLTETQKTQFALGIEGKIVDYLSITGGINAHNVNLGAHLDFNTLSFDYSYRIHDLGNISQFELSIHF